MQIDTLLTNATIYTVNEQDEVITKGYIAIDKGVIIAIGEGDKGVEAYQPTKVIDAAGKVIFPGFINTHIHIFQSLLKGLGADHRLIEWLNLSALPYGEKMGSDLQYEAARVASMEALQSGCTTLCESFYTTQEEALAHAVIQGMQETGIRSIFMRTFCDTGEEYGMPHCFMETIDEAMKKTDALVKQYNGESDMLSIWTGPCVTWSTTKAGYEGMLEYCKSSHIPYTMHLRETEVDDQMCLKYYGKNAIDLLDEVGFLTEDFLAVHCVNLSKEDIALFARRKVSIAHNPMANMYLGSGFAPVPECLKKGITVSLGTDGAASNNTTNMLESIKMATVTQKAVHRDAAIMTAKQVLRMATIEGAKAIKMEDKIGSLEVNKKADLIIFNPDELTSFPMHDPLATLVYASTLTNIETTMVDGKIVYDKGKFSKQLDMKGFYQNIWTKLKSIHI